MNLDPMRIKSTTQLVEVQRRMSEAGREILAAKNCDYGDTENSDPFANLRIHGAYGITVRMQDKCSRLTTYAKSGRLNVSSESVVDTAVDLMNYAAILVAYVLDEQARAKAVTATP